MCATLRRLWSAGLQTEASILGAYMKVIQEAQHYIYIENQYISSSLAGGGVENRLMELIMVRARQAIVASLSCA
jgi:phospholipase D1/2